MQLSESTGPDNPVFKGPDNTPVGKPASFSTSKTVMSSLLTSLVGKFLGTML